MNRGVSSISFDRLISRMLGMGEGSEGIHSA